MFPEKYKGFRFETANYGITVLARYRWEENDYLCVFDIGQTELFFYVNIYENNRLMPKQYPFESLEVALMFFYKEAERRQLKNLLKSNN